MTYRIAKFLRAHIVDIILILVFACVLYFAIASAVHTSNENKPTELQLEIVFDQVTSSNIPAEEDILYTAEGLRFGSILSATEEAAREWAFIQSGGSGAYAYVYASGKDVTVTVSVEASKDGIGYTLCGERLLISSEFDLHTNMFTAVGRIKSISIKQDEEASQ